MRSVVVCRTSKWVDRVRCSKYKLPKRLNTVRVKPVKSLVVIRSSKKVGSCLDSPLSLLTGVNDVTYVRAGRGKIVERLYREVRGVAIPGGSEEILLDFTM